MTSVDALSPIEPARFRHALGHYPTGVCVVAAIEPDAGPVAMVVGSFTSVSLDPPLVGFLPDRVSTSWPRIARAGRFCVNVLAQDQLALCRRFSARGGDKFAGVAWDSSDGGSPIIRDAAAWIDCSLYDVCDAGDHLFVMGRVHDLAVAGDKAPLLFLRGGYGAFAAHELSTG